MAKAKPKPAPVPDHFYKGLGKIRQWIDGFEAAGKHGPCDKDTLRQIELWLRELDRSRG